MTATAPQGGPATGGDASPPVGASAGAASG
jgi:hypothetical protein